MTQGLGLLSAPHCVFSPPTGCSRSREPIAVSLGVHAGVHSRAAHLRNYAAGEAPRSFAVSDWPRPPWHSDVRSVDEPSRHARTPPPKHESAPFHAQAELARVHFRQGRQVDPSGPWPQHCCAAVIDKRMPDLPSGMRDDGDIQTAYTQPARHELMFAPGHDYSP